MLRLARVVSTIYLGLLRVQYVQHTPTPVKAAERIYADSVTHLICAMVLENAPHPL